MKKWTRLLFIAVLFFAYHTLSISQNYIGARVGAFFGHAQTGIITDLLPVKWETGPEIGLYFERELNSSLAIVSGLDYSKKGFMLEESTDINVMGLSIPVGASLDFNMHYLESPLAIKYKISSSDYNFYGMVGASAGYATGGTIRTRANLIVDVNVGEIDIPFEDPRLSRWNYSALVGAGVEKNLGSGKFFADVRYKHGLNSVIANTFMDLDLNNRGISVGLGYAYTFN